MNRMHQNTTTFKADLTIAGGGVAGLALAALLGTQGFKVYLVGLRADF
jgi:2-polyprenyl-6-methoxyphenol hydroxylase-like FAD-dependent oxidoreductase